MRGYRLFGWFVGFTFLFFLSNVQAQEKYPNRTIELTVGWGAGGTADTLARTYNEKLGENLNVQVLVVNRPGGTGALGVLHTIKAKKDGYSLFAGENSSITFTPLVTPEVGYDPLKDLIPLGYFGGAPSIFSVRVDSPFKTFGEFLDYARKNPGKLKNAVPGLFNTGQFNLNILCSRENINITSIPFASGGDATIALLGGHVDMTVSGPVAMGPQIKAGKLRGLVITSKKRLPSFPDIPTAAELGYPYMNLTTWHGTFVASGTPQPILDILIPAMEKAFKDPEVIKRATALYCEVEYKGPEEFRKFLETDIDIARKILKDMKQ